MTRFLPPSNHRRGRPVPPAQVVWRRHVDRDLPEPTSGRAPRGIIPAILSLLVTASPRFDLEPGIGICKTHISRRATVWLGAVLAQGKAYVAT